MWERFSFYGMRALLIFYLTQHFLFERCHVGRDLRELRGDGLPDAGDRRHGRGPLPRLPQGRHRRRRTPVLRASRHGFRGGPGSHGRWRRRTRRHLPAGALPVSRLHRHWRRLPQVEHLDMVGELYAPGDSRRDGGFTLFYMGINLGRSSPGSSAATSARPTAGATGSALRESGCWPACSRSSVAGGC